MSIHIYIYIHLHIKHIVKLKPGLRLRWEGPRVKVPYTHNGANPLWSGSVHNYTRTGFNERALSIPLLGSQHRVAPPNYPLRHPKYHLIETIRPLIEVHLSRNIELFSLMWPILVGIIRGLGLPWLVAPGSVRPRTQPSRSPPGPRHPCATAGWRRFTRGRPEAPADSQGLPRPASQIPCSTCIEGP